MCKSAVGVSTPSRSKRAASNWLQSMSPTVTPRDDFCGSDPPAAAGGADPQKSSLGVTVGLMDWSQFEAALFDLDGVLTPTADLHMRAWRQMFSTYFVEHDVAPAYTNADYFTYVDGRC